jgi:hypothetical protein
MLINWKEFSVAVRAQLPVMILEDRELEKMLSAQTPPPEKTDAIGKPFPGSAVASKQSDIENMKRILRVRKQIAEEKQAKEYISHVNKLISFVEPLSIGSNLWMIFVATEKNVYEIFYVADDGKVLGAVMNQFGA